MTDVLSIDAALRIARQRLQASSPTAALDAELLLGEVLHKSRSWLYTWGDHRLAPEAQASFLALVGRRAEGYPVAYLLGKREFFGLELEVNDSTLIPRADTEVLVEKALELAVAKQGRALDLGTGTGAIALGFASRRPQWLVTGADRIESAVTLAQGNAERLQISNTRWVLSDWFDAEVLSAQRFDMIFSNPPYIATNDHHLDEGDVRFEPRSALVAEEDGLADLRHIIVQARNFLGPDGWLLLEHGYEQGASVRAIFQQHDYRSIESGHDLAGHERITFAQMTI